MMNQKRPHRFWVCHLVLSTALMLSFSGCGAKVQDLNTIVIWHQMRPDERAILQRQLRRYEERTPGIKVVEIYKETEELRSGFVIASIAGQGPDLVYGPSDPIGIYEATKTIQPLEQFLSKDYLDRFSGSAQTWHNDHLYQIADKIGNHLALVYNKKYLERPPTSDRELIEMSRQIQEKHGSLAGRPNVYGLAWNYTEPFFFIPFLTGFGGWVFDEDGVTPSLNSTAMVNALRFVRALRDTHRIIPNESDYEIADALFKDQKTAMLINGDWSWAGYVEKGIDVGIAPLPMISETGLWCAPMTSPKGYSLSANVPPEKIESVIRLLRFLLNEENQLETVRAIMTAPTLRSLYGRTEIRSHPIIMNSLLQIERGRPMPVVPEMRAVWDAMRPPYQAVMGGARTSEQAARDMQDLALKKIRDMNE